MISIFNTSPKDIFDPSKSVTFVELNYRLKHYIHGLKGAKLAIFLQLACSVDKHGVTVMPISKICEDTGYSATEVKDTISELLHIVFYDSATDLEARHNGRHILAKINRKEEGKFATNAYVVFPDSSIVKESLAEITSVVGVAPKGAIDFFAVKDGFTVAGKLAPYYIDTNSTITTVRDSINKSTRKVHKQLNVHLPRSSNSQNQPTKGPSAPKTAAAFSRKKDSEPLDESKVAEVESTLVKKFGEQGRTLWNEVFAKRFVIDLLAQYADSMNTLLYAAAYALKQKQVAPAFVAVLKSAPKNPLPRFSDAQDMITGQEAWKNSFWHQYGRKETGGNPPKNETNAARNRAVVEVF